MTTSSLVTNPRPSFATFLDPFSSGLSFRRVILVGDIHGMYESLQKLLYQVSYDPSSDVLIPVGDFLTRGPHVDSMRTLSFMASNNITAVRGNHDQKVIEWRAWIHWMKTQPEGSRWLEETSAEWAAADAKLEDWIDDKKRKNKDTEWWSKIPKGWKPFDAHYAIAQEMSETQYAYLRSLPYIIHIPHTHAFIVHGGLLASNPKHPYNDPRQPLATMPRLPDCCEDRVNRTETLRRIQEREILNEVPQNTIPWNILNIRGIVDGEVTRDNDGKPWSKAWRQDMRHCAGFNGELLDASTIRKKKTKILPCYPATVVYGHAAGRGLDVKRWSIGLDTGCVYERRLTALVLGGKKTIKRRRVDDDDKEDIEIDTDDDDDGSGAIKVNADQIKFGDSHYGQIVSVKCP
ncbi:hypothetical protein C0989_012287 [Termitomyces sp. Mn162]|nr:hypothetical protein C0989_012287 [Termitomyces sp. Mn162]